MFEQLEYSFETLRKIKRLSYNNPGKHLIYVFCIIFRLSYDESIELYKSAGYNMENGDKENTIYLNLIIYYNITLPPQNIIDIIFESNELFKRIKLKGTHSHSCSKNSKS